MANDHAAFFGDDTPEATPPTSSGGEGRTAPGSGAIPAGVDPLSLFERARTQAAHETGIPADLVPYLEAADADDGVGGVGADGGAADPDRDADRERTKALRALMENSMLLGPDPSVLAEIEGEEAGEEWEDEDGNPVGAEPTHDRLLDDAERDLEESTRVERIYRDIVARAPEHRVQPSLDRVRAVLDILGDPQDDYPAVHITGTNGKTSTARMIDSLLSELGLRIGRFTSPHLEDVRERISLEGEPISRADFIATWDDVSPYIEMVDQHSRAEGGPALSFFEVFTVMAYAAFADHPVDAAVVEVGMGGLWDATNVIDAGVSVIMPIDLDHQKWLGSTVEEIAREKAGIIKPDQIVVIARQPEAALEVLLARAREVDAVVRLEDRDFEVIDRQMGVGGQMVTIRTPAAVYEDVFVPLLGEHQAHNAAAALVATESFLGGRELDASVVERGFMSATSPGRLQVVRTSPTVVLDAAHNPAGARVLRDALEETFDFRHVVGVFSAMGDKDVEGMLGELEPVLESLVLTTMPGPRAMAARDLVEIAGGVFGEDRVELAEDLAGALDRAVELAESSTDPSDTTGVVVFGSIVLAGEAMSLLRRNR